MATAVRRRAGLADDDFADAVSITACILGPTSIVYDPSLAEATYLRRRKDGSFEIALRPGAPDLRFRLLHEVGHVVLGEAGIRLPFDQEESAANYIAAAVMAPVPLLKRAHSYYGEKLRPIAKTFGMSETATQLRLAEVLGDERGVVTKRGHVFVRSQGAFPWAEVALVAVARGQVIDNRLETAPMRGGIDRGRVALRAK